VLPALLFLLLHFVSLPYFHSCARCCFIVLSSSHCLFLSHAFSLAICLAFLLIFLLVRGVLPRVLLYSISHCLLWFHSLYFCIFWFWWISFGLIFVHWFCSHYLQEVCFLIFVCLECFLDVCIIDLRFQNFLEEKLQMVITFDRKLGFRRSKNKSFSKLRNEAPRPFSEGIQIFFSKIISFTLFFNFFCIFFQFFRF